MPGRKLRQEGSSRPKVLQLWGERWLGEKKIKMRNADGKWRGERCSFQGQAYQTNRVVRSEGLHSNSKGEYILWGGGGIYETTVNSVYQTQEEKRSCYAAALANGRSLKKKNTGY